MCIRDRYTLVIDSPSGKVFELQSTELDDATLNTSTIAQWKDADECPLCHFSEHYTRDELNSWCAETLASRARRGRR